MPANSRWDLIRGLKGYQLDFLIWHNLLFYHHYHYYSNVESYSQ